jgi:PAS domain S-box-containing protein
MTEMPGLTALQDSGFEASLLDQVGAGIVATDLTGRITYWNPHASSLFGWPRAKAIGRDVRELLVTPQQEGTENQILGLIRSAESWEGEITILPPGGQAVMCQAIFSPVHEADGALAGGVGVFVDVMERKRAEARLEAHYGIVRVLAEAPTLEEAASRILQAVCESLAWDLGIMWTVDPEARVLRVLGDWQMALASGRGFTLASRRKAMRSGTGLPGKVWLHRRPEWIPDVTVDPTFARRREASEAGLHGAFAFPVQMAEEVVAVLEFFSHDIREPDEVLLKMLDAVGTQIGQFIDRKRSQEAVRQSESRKSAVLRSSLDCVITIDHEGSILEFNPSAERTFGYAQRDVLGKPMVELIIPPALRERHRKAFQRHMETGESAILGKRVELTGMRADGTEFPVELTIARVEGSGPPVFTGYLRDITERKRSEEAQLFLAQANDVLAESLNFRETLAKVARLAVPRLADWCVIHIATDADDYQELAVEHVDPAKVRFALALQKEYPPDSKATRGVPEVLRTGEPELYPDIPDQLLVEAARDERHLQLLRELGLRSAMIVPLLGRGRILGTITLVSAESGRRFAREDLPLVEELARRAAMAIDNARLFEERSYIAHALQQSLLPPELPDIRGIEIASAYHPAGEGYEVGGDFYDIFRTADHAWAFVIGDVCGKGPDAAALTGLARYTIRAAASQEPKPSRILAALNRAIVGQRPDNIFCTVCYVRAKTKQHGARLTVCSAGHPLPLVLRADGSVESAGTPGTLLGVFDDPELIESPVALRAGDALVLYTDGVEGRSAGSGPGTERLKSLLAACAGMDAQAIARRIEDSALESSHQAPHDDVALLVLRIRP